VKKLAEVSSAE